MPSLETLNRLPLEQAEAELLRCCGSRRWASRMASARPFATETDLFRVAETLWEALFPTDWLEAFSHHPKIGQKPAARADLKSTASWAKEEQAGTRSASADVLGELAKGNAEYEKKFGHVFLVCATGKSAEEMLGLLKERLPNSAEKELKVAAKEQSKITRIRLEKWLRS